MSTLSANNFNSPKMSGETMLIIAIVIMGLLVIFSCRDSKPGFSPDYNQKTQSTIDDVEKFRFENHDYIRIGKQDWQTVSHSPDCINPKCNLTDSVLIRFKESILIEKEIIDTLINRVDRKNEELSNNATH